MATNIEKIFVVIHNSSKIFYYKIVRGDGKKGGGGGGLVGVCYKNGVIKTPIELGKVLGSTLKLDQKQKWGIRYKGKAKFIFLWNFVHSPKPAHSGGRRGVRVFL